MSRIRRRLWWLAAIPIVPLVAFALTLAMPVPSWRTGRAPAPPLRLEPGGPAVSMAERIWIDTDAACGATPRTDPDDCFAIALLVRGRGSDIAGISTVFGNAEIAVTDTTTRAVLEVLLEKPRAAVAIHKGAAAPQDVRGPATAKAARDALREALAAGPLTIVSLGPLTNIAAALEQRPDLQANVARLIVVMGRRPGQFFHPAEGAGEAIFFGHGPVFRDFNVAKDPLAAARIVSMRLPTTLIPYDAARRIKVTAADLDALAAADPGLRWIAARSRGWLDYWTENIGQPGFYPFDLVAAGYVLHAGLFACGHAQAWVGGDDAFWTSWLYRPEGLFVDPEPPAAEEDVPRAPVVYCPQTNPDLKRLLLSGMVAPTR